MERLCYGLDYRKSFPRIFLRAFNYFFDFPLLRQGVPQDPPSPLPHVPGALEDCDPGTFAYIP